MPIPASYQTSEAARTAILVEIESILHDLLFRFLYLYQGSVASEGTTW